MLRRFADARLRRDLDKALNARDQARDTARRLFRRLQAARADNATLRAELAVQIEETQEVATELAAERARTQETAGRCGDIAPSLSLLASRIRPTCRLTAGHAGWHKGDDGSEWTLTQETHR